MGGANWTDMIVNPMNDDTPGAFQEAALETGRCRYAEPSWPGGYGGDGVRTTRRAGIGLRSDLRVGGAE